MDVGKILAGLDPYQVEGVQFLAGRYGAILADATGLGKTPQSIRAADFAEAKSVIVVVKKSLVPQWINAINQWSVDPASIAVFVSRSKGWPSARWVVTTYETVVSKLDEFPGKFDVLMVDEAQAIKNRKAKRTLAVKALAKRAKHKWLLTATPMRNKSVEIWSLLNCIAPKAFSSFWKFVYAYYNTTNNGFGIDIGTIRSDREEAFGKVLQEYMLMREKSTVDLPPITFEDVRIPMSPGQAKLYKQMEQDMMAALPNTGEVVLAPNVLSQLTRLRQLADEPSLLPTLHTSALAGKTEWVLDWVPDRAEDEKILVFSVFSSYIHYLSGLLESEVEHRIFTGSMSSAEREKAKQDFLNRDDVRLLMGTYDALSEGQNLQPATLVILLDAPWTPDTVDQAYARSWRRGQENPVHVISLIAEGTVDEYVKQVLADKTEEINEALAMRKVLESMRGAYYGP